MGVGRRAVLGGAAAAGLAGRGWAQGGAPVRVGVLTDEAGPYAASGGAGSVAAAEMAVRDFGGTVLGVPVEVVHADTQNKPDVAGAVARRWFDGGVDMITDLPVTPVALAVQQVAKEKARSVMITAAAISEFTSKFCSPFSSHWADDTHAMAEGTGAVVTDGGGKSWYFVTVDFSFGAALQAAATDVVTRHGGRVLGAAKFAIGNTDFSSQIVQAQASGADVLGLAAVGGDQVTLVKQLAEFGGKQVLAGFLVYLSDVHALGLEAAQGWRFPTSFYWDHSEGTRQFGRRFMEATGGAARGSMPTQNQANVYAATLHFLRGVQAAGSRDAEAVGRAMRGLPVQYFGAEARLRGDGRVLHDLVEYRVKAPGESRGPWDYLAPVGVVAADQAFLPAAAGCGGS